MTTLTKRPMTPEEVAKYLVVEGQRYAHELTQVQALSIERARSHVARLHAQAFEENQPIPPHEVWILEVEGSRVGVLHTACEGSAHSPHVFVYFLGIDEEHRRRGYAHAALQLVSDEGRERGASQVVLNVRPGNQAARALYRAAGFSERQIKMGKSL